MSSTVLTAPSTGAADGTLAMRAIAVVACAAIGLRIDLIKGITPGLVVMVLLAPVWWPQLRTSRLTRALVGATVLALLSGLVLAWTAKNQREVDWRLAGSFASTVVLACAAVVVLLWARTLISVSAVLSSVVAGFVLYQLTVPSLWASDPWKFGFARPVTLLVLVALAWSSKRVGRARPALTVAILLVLVVVGLASDSRSEAGFLALTAMLTIWQALAVGGRRRLRAASPVLLIGTLGVAVYVVATQLFVSGALGADVQQRSAAQIEASGSLLLGGRPEWSATVQLMAERPGGYGLGVLADSRDVQLADNGFASINVDPASGYEAYIIAFVTNDGFHLHSVAADLWAATGPVGLALAALVLVVAAWGLSVSLAVGRADPLLIYSAVIVAWDIAFSPLTASVFELVVGLFVAIVSREYVKQVRTPATPLAVGPPATDDRVLHRAAAAAAASPDRNGGSRGPR